MNNQAENGRKEVLTIEARILDHLKEKRIETSKYEI